MHLELSKTLAGTVIRVFIVLPFCHLIGIGIGYLMGSQCDMEEEHCKNIMLLLSYPGELWIKALTAVVLPMIVVSIVLSSAELRMQRGRDAESYLCIRQYSLLGPQLLGVRTLIPSSLSAWSIGASH